MSKTKAKAVRGCGCGMAGIGIFNDTEIQRCDDCNLFDEDTDAAAAVEWLLHILGEVYSARPGDSVACSVKFIEETMRAAIAGGAK